MHTKTIEELKSKNIELEAILQTNPDLIFILDRDSNFLEFYTNTPNYYLCQRKNLLVKI